MKPRSFIFRKLRQHLRSLLWVVKKSTGELSAIITEPQGNLDLNKATHTAVIVVGPSFNQNIPDAMMTCRMGYCNAFEKIGIPYVIIDIKDLEKKLPSLNKPFCIIFGSDYAYMSYRIVKFLRNYPKLVWVNPWFDNSDNFFKSHNLDPSIWTWSNKHRLKILESEPSFAFTATVKPGLFFFTRWEKAGMKVVSLPLACDTSLYNLDAPYRPEFEGIRLAFVGGYWESKGTQIDEYLRPFEDDLVVYGYNRWPYRGYRGVLSREAEPSLYRQSLVSPTINEPTVKLLHGQINERVFKVLGSGGVPVVDAVPAYKELFKEEELLIPKDANEFKTMLSELLIKESLREQYGRKGYNAVITKHTYVHRAKVVLKELGIPIGD